MGASVAGYAAEFYNYYNVKIHCVSRKQNKTRHVFSWMYFHRSSTRDLMPEILPVWTRCFDFITDELSLFARFITIEKETNDNWFILQSVFVNLSSKKVFDWEKLVKNTRREKLVSLSRSYWQADVYNTTTHTQS